MIGSVHGGGRGARAQVSGVLQGAVLGPPASSSNTGRYLVVYGVNVSVFGVSQQPLRFIEASGALIPNLTLLQIFWRSEINRTGNEAKPLTVSENWTNINSVNVFCYRDAAMLEPDVVTEQ